jgi:hypothetical protein
MILKFLINQNHLSKYNYSKKCKYNYSKKCNKTCFTIISIFFIEIIVKQVLLHFLL